MIKTFLLFFILTSTQLFALEQLTDENFDEKNKKKGISLLIFLHLGVILVQKQIKKLVEYNKNKRDDVKIYKVDISEQIKLTKRFNADSVPLFLYIKDGKVLSRENGIKTVQRIKDCANRYF